MMVYFSVYIPFYAWIAGPLFNLLKGTVKWEWTKYTPKPSNSVSRFRLMHLFVDLQNQDLLIDYIQTLAISDWSRFYNKSKGFNSKTLNGISLTPVVTLLIILKQHSHLHWC